MVGGKFVCSGLQTVANERIQQFCGTIHPAIIFFLALIENFPSLKIKMHEYRDPAEYDEASYEVDFAALCDGPHEPTVSTYREASEKMMRTLNAFISFLANHGYSRSKTLWGIAYALGHPLTAGMSMLEAARMLGCTKQAISKIACDFLTDTGLPPSSALKSEEAKQTYKKTNGNRKQHTNA